MFDTFSLCQKRTRGDKSSWPHSGGGGVPGPGPASPGPGGAVGGPVSDQGFYVFREHLPTVRSNSYLSKCDSFRPVTRWTPELACRQPTYFFPRRRVYFFPINL